MNKKGQSIIEYVLLAILVILGIVFMGAYVLRSVDAHFKLWDDGVQDSFQETISQAPLNDVPVINSDCECTPYNATCGSSAASSFCPENQREVDYNCTIPGCNTFGMGVDHCVDDPNCCSTSVKKGCGIAPIPGGNIPSETPITCPSGTPPSKDCYCPVGATATTVGCPTGVAKCCTTPTAGQVSFCYYGQAIWGNACGANNVNVCIDDTMCPMPACQGFSLFQNSSAPCPSIFNSPSNGLTQNTNIYYAGNSPSACGTTDGQGACQVYCKSPYTLAGSGTSGSCILKYTVAAISCSAPTNTTKVSCTTHTNSPYVITNNDESFPIHANDSTLISTVSTIPYGPTVPPSPGISGEYNGGCGNPGEPSQTCAVSINP